ncbi:hypothetical protein D3C73_1310320 [compost metagenome]
MRLKHRIIAGSVGIRAGLAVSRQRNIDQLRVGDPQGGSVKTEASQIAGDEVLNQHISIGRERPDARLTFGRGEIH